MAHEKQPGENYSETQTHVILIISPAFCLIKIIKSLARKSANKKKIIEECISSPQFELSYSGK